jgi:hypothetical protein
MLAGGADAQPACSTEEAIEAQIVPLSLSPFVPEPNAESCTETFAFTTVQGLLWRERLLLIPDDGGVRLVIDEELFDRAILADLRQESRLRFASHRDG